MQESFNTTMPTFFDKNNFMCQRRSMQYYLMTDTEMWSIVIEGFVTPTLEDGKILKYEK